MENTHLFDYGTFARLASSCNEQYLGRRGGGQENEMEIIRQK